MAGSVTVSELRHYLETVPQDLRVTIGGDKIDLSYIQVKGVQCLELKAGRDPHRNTHLK